MVAGSLTAATAVLFVSALGLGRTAAAVPLAVAAPTLVVLLTQLSIEARQRHAFAREQAAANGQPTRGLGTREAATYAWMLGLLALFWALGPVVGVPAYLVFYLRWRSGESWFTALLAASVAWCALVALLELLLSIQLPPGAIRAWLTQA